MADTCKAEDWLLESEHDALPTTREQDALTANDFFDEVSVELEDIKPVPQWRMAAVAMWQFAFSSIDSFVLAFLVPLQTLEIVGKESKGAALGVFLALGTIVATVVSLIFGQVSDNVSTPFGKRMPFIVVASVGTSLANVALAWYGDSSLYGVAAYVGYGGIFLVMRSCLQVGQTAFQPLLPDLVPVTQIGTISGWWAMGQMVGNLFGAAGGPVLMDQTGPLIISIILSALLVIGTLITASANREKPRPARQPYDVTPPTTQRCARFPALRFLVRFMKPFASANFRWILATRFVTQLGFSLVSSFAFYFIHDVAPAPYRIFSWEITRINDATAIFLGSVMATAVLSGYAGGALGDLYGRKRMVYVSSVFQTIACVGFAVFSAWPHDFVYIVALSILFGLGLGAYLAVDFALATECLPSEASRGTDLAVWGLASSLPMAIASPLGGLMLDNGQRFGHELGVSNLGYVCLFGSCAALLGVSTVLVRNISVGNPIKRHHSAAGVTLDMEKMEDTELQSPSKSASDSEESKEDMQEQLCASSHAVVSS